MGHRRIAVSVGLVVCHIAWQSAQALPISDSTFHSRVPTCDDSFPSRTTWDIIRSCLATVFSCVWVALHPNIPSPEDTWLTINRRRLQLMGITLIAPEFVIMWAMRQWVVSRRLSKVYQGIFFFVSYSFVRALMARGI
jgi:hypothetical protein